MTEIALITLLGTGKFIFMFLESFKHGRKITVSLADTRSFVGRWMSGRAIDELKQGNLAEEKFVLT